MLEIDKPLWVNRVTMKDISTDPFFFLQISFHWLQALIYRI